MARIRPPLPPDSGTDEDENYQVDPRYAPTVPPKGDPKTGQPVGPAYAKMPRDAQRGAVDKTFDQMVTDARSSKGSVFDTAFDKALRFGAADPTGGLQPMGGVVANPGSAAFKEILARDPRWAAVMQRMKPILEYASKPSRLFGRATGPVEGVTQTFKPSQMAAVREAVSKGRGARGRVPIEPDELARLEANVQKVPGSSIQQFPLKHNTERDPMIAKYHEGFHSLYGGKSGGESLLPNIPPARAKELMHRVLDRTNTTAQERFITAAQYDKDPVHGLLDALAQYRHGKYGGMNVK